MITNSLTNIKIQIKKNRLLSVVILLFLAGALATGCFGRIFPAKRAVSAPVARPETATLPPASSASDDLLSALEGRLESIYETVNPAVVNIRVVQKQTVSLPSFPELPFFPPIPNTPGEPQEFFRQGSGSGFVWDTEGHIVTNNHVIADADKITVTFADGTALPAEVIGADPDSDLAVLKVDVPAEELKPVQLADSLQVKVGQFVIAIGNPFGLKGTMTTGIVSALGRSIPTNLDSPAGPGYMIPDIIQTDASINPGNSGGVLLNSEGQVIGVTSAIFSPSGTSDGVGFAIPSSSVAQVVPALIETGRYDHPWLGISGASLSPELAEAAKLNRDQRGALVAEVISGGPADDAGLRGSDRQAEINGQEARVGGDIITAIDGHPVQSMDDLISYLLGRTRVGQQVTLTILRDGQEELIRVTLAARPKPETAQAQEGNVFTSGVQLGIRGASMSPEVAKAMDLPTGQQGVLVQQVEVDSPADQAGLRGSYKPLTIEGQRTLVGGDIIIAADDQPLNQVADLQAFLSQVHPGQQVTFTILRDGKEMTITVTFQEQPAAKP